MAGIGVVKPKLRKAKANGRARRLALAPSSKEEIEFLRARKAAFASLFARVLINNLGSKNNAKNISKIKRGIEPSTFE